MPAKLFLSPPFVPADFLPVAPICEKLGYTKLMAKTQGAAATATRTARQVEAAMGVK